MITKTDLMDIVLDYIIPCVVVVILFLVAAYCPIPTLFILAWEFFNGFLACCIVLICCSNIRLRGEFKRINKEIKKFKKG